jgi:hypothetical protein
MGLKEKISEQEKKDQLQIAGENLLAYIYPSSLKLG